MRSERERGRVGVRKTMPEKRLSVGSKCVWQDRGDSDLFHDIINQAGLHCIRFDNEY